MPTVSFITFYTKYGVETECRKKIIVFDERDETLKHALCSALNERNDDYVFVRLNPHLASSIDKLLTIDFIWFGKSINLSLHNRSLATSKEMLEGLILNRVPSLAQLAKQNLPNNLPLPNHVVKKLCAS